MLLTESDRQYLSALALALDLAPEGSEEEQKLDAAYNAACERLWVDPRVYLYKARQRFFVHEPATAARVNSGQFHRGRLGR